VGLIKKGEKVKKEIKYYKAEVGGDVYVRSSKNDYTVAMVISKEDEGYSVVKSFNTKEVSKATVLRHLRPLKGYDWYADNKARYDAYKVYPVPAVQISKEEYNKIREFNKIWEEA
tara:strand:+ start:1288 stop:1632 length:345 start_codon:yes stop_codon:yes gene_type:complete